MPSCPACVGLVFIALTLAGAAISLGTPYWIEAPDFNAGLWQHCDNTTCHFISINATNLPEWFNPTRIVGAVSVANALVALTLAVGYICCGPCVYNIRVLQILILVLIIGCLELAGPVLVYLVKYTDTTFYDRELTPTPQLGWGFYLAAASALAFLVDLLLMVCETTNSSRAMATDMYQVPGAGYQPVT